MRCGHLQVPEDGSHVCGLDVDALGPSIELESTIENPGAWLVRAPFEFLHDDGVHYAHRFLADQYRTGSRKSKAIQRLNTTPLVGTICIEGLVDSEVARVSCIRLSLSTLVAVPPHEAFFASLVELYDNIPAELHRINTVLDSPRREPATIDVTISGGWMVPFPGP